MIHLSGVPSSPLKKEVLEQFSHALRTPLNTMLGVAELLGDGPVSPEQRRQVEMLRRAGARLVALLDGLFAALGVEPGRATGAVGTFPSPELRERYVARRAREVIEARETLHRRDFGALAVLGHNLRGSGGSYGFPRLGALGERIEAAAQARDHTRLERLLGRMASEVSAMTATGAATATTTETKAMTPRARPASGTHAKAEALVGPRARRGHGGR